MGRYLSRDEPLLLDEWASLITHWDYIVTWQDFPYASGQKDFDGDDDAFPAVPREGGKLVSYHEKNRRFQQRRQYNDDKPWKWFSYRVGDAECKLQWCWTAVLDLECKHSWVFEVTRLRLGIWGGSSDSLFTGSVNDAVHSSPWMVVKRIDTSTAFSFYLRLQHVPLIAFLSRNFPRNHFYISQLACCIFAREHSRAAVSSVGGHKIKVVVWCCSEPRYADSELSQSSLIERAPGLLMERACFIMGVDIGKMYIAFNTSSEVVHIQVNDH